jgi:hypothetical protein
MDVRVVPGSPIRRVGRAVRQRGANASSPHGRTDSCTLQQFNACVDQRQIARLPPLKFGSTPNARANYLLLPPRMDGRWVVTLDDIEADAGEEKVETIRLNFGFGIVEASRARTKHCPACRRRMGRQCRALNTCGGFCRADFGKGRTSSNPLVIECTPRWIRSGDRARRSIGAHLAHQTPNIERSSNGLGCPPFKRKDVGSNPSRSANLELPCLIRPSCAAIRSTVLATRRAGSEAAATSLQMSAPSACAGSKPAITVTRTSSSNLRSSTASTRGRRHASCCCMSSVIKPSGNFNSFFGGFVQWHDGAL